MLHRSNLVTMDIVNNRFIFISSYYQIASKRQYVNLIISIKTDLINDIQNDTYNHWSTNHAV